MKFDAKTFCRDADAVFSVARESSAVPIFEYVLVETVGAKSVALSASNHENSIKLIVDVIEAPAKSFCIHAKSLWPVLKTLDGQTSITLKDKTAVVKCIGTSVEVQVFPAADFFSIDITGGTKVLEGVEIAHFLEVLSDMSYFMDGNDGLKPAMQHMLVGPKGCYAFHAPVGAVSIAYVSKTPFMVPPAVRSVMGKMTGKWDVVYSDGWIRFDQGHSYYRRSMPSFDGLQKSIDTCHSVVSTAANTPAIATFEVARIAPSIARSVLVDALNVYLVGGGNKITVTCRNDMRGVLIEEELPSDGVEFSTAMRSKMLHGALDIIGYGGTVSIVQNTIPKAIEENWPSSILVKNSEKRIMALLAPVRD